jgi:hypothetical protein
LIEYDLCFLQTTEKFNYSFVCTTTLSVHWIQIEIHMKIQFTLLVVLFMQLNTVAQPCYNRTPTVLLVGDSWMEYTVLDSIPRMVFDKYGFHDMVELDNSYNTAIGGTAAADWLQPAMLDNIRIALDDNPSIAHMMISPAGNDFLALWHKDSSSTYVQSFLDTIENNIHDLMDSILVTRPNLNVAIMGADYFNFTDIDTTDALFLQLGSPTPAELNSAFSLLELRKIAVAQNYSNVYYVHNFGLMQYHYGYNGLLGNFSPQVVPPPGNNPPNYAPFPGGDFTFPSDVSAMRYGIDPFHLTPEGYFLLAENAVQDFFWDLFRGPVTSTLTSTGNGTDGWVSGAGTFGTNEIQCGEANGESISAVFSFNTSSVANASITRASLFLKAELVNGISPFDWTTGSYVLGNPCVDIVSGSFGGNLVEQGDDVATADFYCVGCFVGTVSDTGYYLRIDIDAAALSAINSNSMVQFRINFGANTGGNNAVNFFTGDHPVFAPMLDLEYTTSTNVDENVDMDLLSVYPTIFTEKVTVSTKETMNKIEVFNVQGKLCYYIESVDVSSLEINTVDWNSGLYIVKVHTATKQYSSKIIKTGH